MKITVFTDGAAKGNPGPGGYGVAILMGDKVVELGARKDRTTNNEMELKAVVEAVRFAVAEKVSPEIYSDSKYVIDGATGWTFGWVKNGWKTKAGEDVKNKELWQELVELLKEVKVDWHKVPGHVGIIGNERADAIASDFGEGKQVNLYNGSRSDYGYNIENTDYDKAKAAERSSARKRQSQKAYSYISKVGGVVETHTTWKECEARVKGEKGARFKKAISAAEEVQIAGDFVG
ncbi:MAG: ribonuclease HI [Candidatus Pacebacteria bacterium]|nr:ribonuclease HI [Candidatus Paceibacterota bacterium]